MLSSFSFIFYCANRANIFFKRMAVIMDMLVQAIPTDAKGFKEKKAQEI
jgi:hypothetical protein